MAQAIVVTLEKNLAASTAEADYTKAPTGKALARETDRLDAVIRNRGITPLTSLLSENQEVLRAQMVADGFDPAKMRLPPERWFEAGEGLNTVRALSEYVTGDLNHFKQPNAILRDLKAVEALLAAAQAAGVKFHFTKT